MARLTTAEELALARHDYLVQRHQILAREILARAQARARRRKTRSTRTRPGWLQEAREVRGR